MAARQKRQRGRRETEVRNQKHASGVEHAGSGQGGGREAKGVVVILVWIAQDSLHAERKRSQKERHERFPAPLAEPDLEGREHHRQHPRQLLRFVGQPEGRETRSEEHTSERQSPCNLVCRLLLEKKK